MDAFLFKQQYNFGTITTDLKVIQKVPFKKHHLFFVYFALGGLFTGGMAYVVQGSAFGFSNVPILALVPAFLVGAMAALIISYLVFNAQKKLRAAYNHLEVEVDNRVSELKQSEQRLRDIVGVATDWFWETGPDSQYTKISDSFFEETGFKPEDIIGKTRMEFIGPESISSNPEIWRSHEDDLKHHRPFRNFEYFQEDADGLRRYVSVGATPFFDINGVFQGYHGAARDITPRKIAELALKESEGKFKSYAEMSVDWFWEMDEELRFTDISDGQFKAIGFEKSNFIGKTRRELVSNRDRNSVNVKRHLEDLDAHRSFDNFSYSYKTPDGGECYSINSGRPLFDDQGSFIGYRGTSSDITEQKRLEHDLLLAKEKAESANRAKSEFLSSMSHELRTPLNAVIGFSHAMKEGSFGPLNKKYSEYAGYINSSGNHLLELVNDILDLAMIEHETVELKIEEATPKELIGEVIPIFSKMMKNRKVEFVDLCSGHENVPVLVDKTRMKQVLLNLFTNAIKYNTEGGKVTLDCEGVADGMTKITVGDTGLGIPENLQKHVFEAFNRLGFDDSNIKGTGIGLTVSRHLLELMGGRIGFESTEGQGSKFWILIPTPKG